MFSFLKTDISGEIYEGHRALLLRRVRQTEDGLDVLDSSGEEKGFFHGVSAGGTGLYTDHEFKIGTQIYFSMSHPEAPNKELEIGMQVVWSRLQDRDNIAAICIRKMIFEQYEDQGKEIEPEILRLLHSPGRSSTDQLIQTFSIFSLENIKFLDMLKQEYLRTHPETNHRFGAKILEESQKNWKLIIQDIYNSYAPESESEVMKQFNRRSSQR